MNNKQILVVKGKAGLGNRLLCVLSSILYAEITNRSIYIDWSDKGYSHNRENSFPILFKEPALSELPSTSDADSVTPRIWREHLLESVDEVMAKYELEGADEMRAINAKYSINLSCSDYSQATVVRWSYTDELYKLRKYFNGEFSQYKDMKDWEILSTIMKTKMCLNDPIQSKVEEFKTQYFAETNIGLHIRYSDRKNPFTEYPKLVDKILVEKPAAKIFLATDNKMVEEEFKARYPGVITTIKWQPEEGEPIHRVKSMPNKTEGGIEALVDMYLLGSCDYLIYNRTSTFGVCAALLSNAPQHHIIDTAPINFSPRYYAKQLYQWGVSHLPF